MFQSEITEDPAVAAAIADFSDSVIEIRVRSAALFDLKGDDARAAEQSAIDDLTGAMQARCERIDISLDDLFRMINDRLRSLPNNPQRPYGDYERALLDENTRAHAAETQVRRERTRTEARHTLELEAIDRLIQKATAERIAADRAHAGFFAGWAVR